MEKASVLCLIYKIYAFMIQIKNVTSFAQKMTELGQFSFGPAEISDI